MRVTEYDDKLGPYCEIDYNWVEGLREVECPCCWSIIPVGFNCPCDGTGLEKYEKPTNKGVNNGN